MHIVFCFLFFFSDFVLLAMAMSLSLALTLRFFCFSIDDNIEPTTALSLSLSSFPLFKVETYNLVRLDQLSKKTLFPFVILLMTNLTNASQNKVVVVICLCKPKGFRCILEQRRKQGKGKKRKEEKRRKGHFPDLLFSSHKQFSCWVCWFLDEFVSFSFSIS